MSHFAPPRQLWDQCQPPTHLGQSRCPWIYTPKLPSASQDESEEGIECPGGAEIGWGFQCGSLLLSLFFSVRMAVVQNGFSYQFPTQASFSGIQTSKPCPHCPLVDSSVQGSLSLVEKWSPLKANAAPSWLSLEVAHSYMEGFNLGTAEQAPPPLRSKILMAKPSRYCDCSLCGIHLPSHLFPVLFSTLKGWSTEQ